jgi:hypothetical protein
MTIKEKALLSLSSILSIGAVVFALNHSENELVNNINEDVKNNDKGRNERSTPRSFILPATPAVAIRQEQKLRTRSNELQVRHCMLKLYDLGYMIMNFEDIFDIHIFIALMDFQSRNSLPKTGMLDDLTIKLLGCEH